MQIWKGLCDNSSSVVQLPSPLLVAAATTTATATVTSATTTPPAAATAAVASADIKSWSYRLSHSPHEQRKTQQRTCDS